MGRVLVGRGEMRWRVQAGLVGAEGGEGDSGAM